jgi:transposase-like protein
VVVRFAALFFQRFSSPVPIEEGRNWPQNLIPEKVYCSCCQTFRTQVPGIEAKAQYTNSVREAVLDRLLEDQMSLERIQAALRRDFLLELSSGFVYDCLRWKIQQVDMADYRRWTLQEFSGTLCIDEIHLGRFTLLLATDPLRDFPVAFALVSRNDQDHLVRFLRQLRDHGLDPRVVVTDGSSLYPTVLAQVWPHAEHQLCIFHVLQDLNRDVLDAVRRLRKQLARRAGKGRGRRGRPRKDQAARQRRRRELQEKAQFVFRHRYLVVRRRESLSTRERQDLVKVLEYLPALGLLRRFVDRVHKLLERAQTLEQAWQRFADLQTDAAFATDPDLAAVLAGWTAEKFAKMVAFLRSPLGVRVRTNNHVERMNRKLRHYEKVRYRWRQAKAIVRFVVLALAHLWRSRQGVPSP